MLLIFLFAVGFSNRKTDLYKNMVNASVMISNDYGWGSGVFIDDNVIVTAAHVLRHVNACNVELTDGTVLEVNDFYIDDKEDIGFIFIDADELHIAEISTLRSDIGDIVYLVGTPHDRLFKFTMTKGIISHLDRDIPELNWKDLLQVNITGGPGSSGGPLYDSEGRVIGIYVGYANADITGISLCENVKNILEAYERCMEFRNAFN